MRPVNQIKNILLRLRWKNMSPHERHAYLWEESDRVIAQAKQQVHRVVSKNK